MGWPSYFEDIVDRRCEEALRPIEKHLENPRFASSLEGEILSSVISELKKLREELLRDLDLASDPDVDLPQRARNAETRAARHEEELMHLKDKLSDAKRELEQLRPLRDFKIERERLTKGVERLDLELRDMRYKSQQAERERKKVENRLKKAEEQNRNKDQAIKRSVEKLKQKENEIERLRQQECSPKSGAPSTGRVKAPKRSNQERADIEMSDAELNRLLDNPPIQEGQVDDLP